jgi:glycerol kinase
MNTGTSPVQSRHGLLTTIAWSVDGQVEYALEGSVFIAGAAIQWLRDQLGLVETAGETESLARSISSTEGVFLIPAFTGLGAPYWDSGVRGMLIGLTRGSGRAHLVRAALESIAYQTVDVVRCFERDSGHRVLRLQVDGGACANNFLMQFQADLLGIPLRRPKVIETTALGAAFLAGLGVGFWESREQIARHWQEDRVFLPKMEENDRQRRQERWQSAIQLARQWRLSS